MAVLGIESSAHTFGAGVSSNGKILSNAKAMYKISDKGMIPSKLAEFHASNAKRVIEKAIADAGIGLSGIEAIGYTKGPGLGPCLRIGELSAISLASKLNVPVYPVNHAMAHIQITTGLSRMENPLALYVSGGNSQILSIISNPYKHYHVHGETLDIGIGNMLDNFARAAGMNPAWGSTVAKAAENGSYISMPYTVKGMDFTFTGILTYAIKALEKNKVEDVAFSLQETSFAMLSEAAERAMLLAKSRGIILCGGVAQSQRLQSIIAGMAASHKAKFFVAPNEYNADNGAMIAYVAEKMHRRKGVKFDRLGVDQKYRIDRVDASWL